MMIPEASRSREDSIDDEGKILISIFIQNLGNGNKAQTNEDAYTCVGYTITSTSFLFKESFFDFY